MPATTLRARTRLIRAPFFPRNRALIAAACTIGALFAFASTAHAQRSNAADRTWPSAAVPILERLNDTTVSGDQRFEPAIAGGLSAVLPGAGQFYNQQNLKGGLMLAGFGASIVLAATGFGDKDVCVGEGPGRFCETHPFWPNSRFWIGVGTAAGFYAWSIMDAIAVATRRTADLDSGRRGADLELAPRLRRGDLALLAALRFRI